MYNITAMFLRDWIVTQDFFTSIIWDVSKEALDLYFTHFLDNLH